MTTSCVRHRQIELGVIRHEGRDFVAIGASVVGRQLTAYTKSDGREIQLTSWCGSTVLVVRSEVVERYCDDSLAIVFRLTANRFIVGYALAANGMLFRGELVSDSDENDARYLARRVSEYFAQLDADDEEAFGLTDE